MSKPTVISIYRSIWLFVVAVIGAACFFVIYPLQDPASTARYRFGKEEMLKSAVEVLSRLGYRANDYEPSASFKADKALLDSLQYRLGRREAVRQLKESEQPNIKPYFWNITFAYNSPDKQPSEEEISGRNEERPFRDRNELILRFDSNKRLIAFDNPREKLPVASVNRSALSAIFKAGADTSYSEPFSALTDSLLQRLLYFSPRQNVADTSRGAAYLQRLTQRLQRGMPHRFTSRDAQKLASYYLAHSGWKPSYFSTDTVLVERLQTASTAKVRFQSKEQVLQQKVAVEVQVTSTGRMISMTYTYNRGNTPSPGNTILWGVTKGVFVFLFCLAGIIIFFFRIRLRAIDTRSALVVAVVMGVVLSVYLFLNSFGEMNFFGTDREWTESILLLVQVGIGGALASLGFFVLFSISDSIIRQHWPEKLSTYDYLRQGMLFNKPVGSMVVQSVLFAFILAGVWSVILFLFPNAYLEHGMVFISGNVSWPPLFIMLEILWLSLALLLSIFMVIGGQVYAQSKNKWIAAAVTILACGVIIPLRLSAGPAGQEFLLGALAGVLLTIIFIKRDFLTLLLSHMLFLALLGTASGWMVPNSPDLYIFLIFIFFLLILSGIGLYTAIKGKEEHVLPRYIPQYVEDLAQEERIKQELEIAREVQQSFLPSEIPNIMGLDIAAHCQPAYETGGDYFDLIQLDDNRVAIVIGDVSGKGIQAAFYMTFTKGIIHTLCRETDSPAELLKKANRLFFDNAHRGTFISLVYGIIDLSKKTFTFARAGHNPIIHLKGETLKVEKLQPAGLGLGLAKGAPFDNTIKEVEMPLGPGDVLVLYTDGITEALNEVHQFYGDDQLSKLLKKEQNQPAHILLRHLYDDVQHFMGRAKQHDDMTIMVIKPED